MKTVTRADEPTVAPDCTPAHYQRQIRLLRLNVAILALTLVLVALYAHRQKALADTVPVLGAPSPALHSARSRIITARTPVTTDAPYYKVTLIDEDHKEIPLTGVELRIDLGEGRLLDVDLARKPAGFLYAWAPPDPEDKFWNRVVFHPHCANAYSLELKQSKRKAGTDTDAADPADMIQTQAPR